ncbi:metal dependent phosphohydrolase [Methanothermus fervidus DSM 2088]|uniref:Metal dependent phosphohydrolase n=1 Tax=Methanothermus fervidus (strain ATCC 43054 / DSM 2088 / JCM 10308 / V24 S) TaxID=523846 RepID=E3GX80_METFV|nr:HD domain-containing protein [Methanothermus fervidus]ADP78075.1 metal dependent phosphohydrolase [Methanothermus fervidus DSM 2088]
MKFIRDSIHGNLKLDDFEIKIIDTYPVQRLRRVKQLGFSYLVYPGANHSRFEHSIGTLYLASSLAESLNLSKEEKEIVRIAALLHDIGHGPFSHVSENILGYSHEDLTVKVIKKSVIADILREKFQVKEITDVIKGKGILGQMLSSELDVDKMDYLLRDSYYTGVAYGIIDIERLISSMRIEKNIVLDKKGVQAAESTLLARYFMYPTVYQHHTTRIANAMFGKALKKLVSDGIIDPKKIYRYDDIDIVAICRKQKNGIAKDIIDRLDRRNLLKIASSIKLANLSKPEKVFEIDDRKIRKIEEEIAEDMKVENRDYVIVSMPEYPRLDETKIQVVDEYNNIAYLSDVSTLVKALENAKFDHAEICLYVPKEELSKFKKFELNDYFNLE